PCQADDECTSITNPGHPDPEHAIVVHTADAVRLSVDAEDHLSRCGAFIHHEASEAFAVVEPRCIESRCGSERTVMHLE
ncbi:MAG: hypothetical protein JRH11_23000, partial [Deltaproteobacteria bacterium]|nr:hypothetical protein [Deltaproteobacteria bacterium]